MPQRIGLLGVGELGEAIVTGLAGTPEPPEMFLSPRSADTARELAERFPTARVCPDNQSVVDRSEIVLLLVRPDIVAEVLDALEVPAERLVVSAVAGWSRDRVAKLLPQHPEVVRTIPLPAVRSHDGVTAIFPTSTTVEKLFGGLGTVVVADSEQRLSALSAATATMSSYLSYLQSVGEWLVGRGWSQSDAEGFVRGLFAGLGPALAGSSDSLADLVRAHETPGGLNEQIHREWFGADNRGPLDAALDRIFERVDSPDPDTT